MILNLLLLEFCLMHISCIVNQNNYKLNLYDVQFTLSFEMSFTLWLVKYL
jgi:hypothetical protein